MVELETVHELAEDLANKLGIHRSSPERQYHSTDCKCRKCFITKMADRIREAVANDEYLLSK